MRNPTKEACGWGGARLSLGRILAVFLLAQYLPLSLFQGESAGKRPGMYNEKNYQQFEAGTAWYQWATWDFTDNINYQQKC